MNSPTPKNVHFNSKGKDAEVEEVEKDPLSNSEKENLNSEDNTTSSGEEVENLEGDIEEEEDGETNESDEFQNVKDRQEVISYSY